MRRAAPDVVYTTMGQSSLSALSPRKNYRWRGVEPGDPRYREVVVRPGGPPPMSAARLQRIAELAALLDKGLSVEQAGKELGVALRTAEVYEREGRHLRRSAP